MSAMIDVELNCFGSFRLLLGESVRLSVPMNASLDDLKQALAEKIDAKKAGFDPAALLAVCAIADEETVLPADYRFSQSRKLALLPPVSGG